jgi:hypothetical protein
MAPLSKPPSNDPMVELGTGLLYWFRDWPNPAVPEFGAGVYTIWHIDGRFIYVGMSGRSITAETIPRASPHGLHTRLRTHFSGRRSGDQFCVYVADRLVLAALSPADIQEVGAGRHQMDAHVRKYIHANLGYRFVMVGNGKAALEIEKLIKNGEWLYGKPLLNPTGA